MVVLGLGSVDDFGAGVGFALGCVVVEALGGVGEVDVVVFGEGVEDGFPDLLLGAAAFAGIAEVADGEHDATVLDAGVDGGGEFVVEDHELLGGVTHLLLSCFADGASVHLGYFEKELFGFFPVAFEGDEDGYLVPYVMEALSVVGQYVVEDAAVGYVDDASGALVGIYPVAYLEEAKHENALVDDVAPVVSYLNPVTHVEGLAPEDEGPACEVDQRGLQGDGEACREESEVCGYGLETGKPNATDDDECEGPCDVGDQFANPVLGLNLAVA